MLREGSLFMGWGGHTTRGAKNFGRVAKGGKIFLDKPPRGANNFGLGQFFFNVPKTQFFHVLWVFWALLIFWSKGGGEKFWTRREGGGEKCWTCHLGGAKNFGL